MRTNVYRGGVLLFASSLLSVYLCATGGCAPKEVIIPEQAYIHISFDDVEHCFNNLSAKNYEEIWDEPFFEYLQELNEDYGAKFSLYTYNNILEAVPDKYAANFSSASTWLKIGFHAENPSVKSATAYDEGKNAWNVFVSEAFRITGDYNCIDRMPRLHYFGGTEDALIGMRDAEYGAQGFLCADDSRLSYYFNAEIASYLYDHDYICDVQNEFVFITTDMRADWFNTNFTTTNRYNAPTERTVYQELIERFSSTKYENTTQSYIFFGHEWDMYNGTTIKQNVAKRYEDICEFGYDYKIEFAFSQDRTFLSTPYDITK